ncbi:PITH domain-containing protein At3g04780 [Linum perenne]
MWRSSSGGVVKQAFKCRQQAVEQLIESPKLPFSCNPRLWFCPKTVKLFSNKEHMGFMYRISYSCFISQELSVSNVSSVWKPVALTYVKFQNVRSVTIFIEDNQSKGHVNKVQKIAFFGSTVETTDMKGLKKIEDH